MNTESENLESLFDWCVLSHQLRINEWLFGYEREYKYKEKSDQINQREIRGRKSHSIIFLVELHLSTVHLGLILVGDSSELI